jgi:hypothetical protein
MLRFLWSNWLALVVLGILVWWIWSQAGQQRQFQSSVDAGFRELQARIVATSPGTLEDPNFLDRFFKTDRWKRYEDQVSRLSTDLREVLAGRDAVGVTILESSTPGDTVLFPFGGVVDRPDLTVDVPEPGTHRLILNPHDLRIGVVETDRGEWLAEVEDLTLGRKLPVTDFSVRRRPPSWDAEWLRWTVGVGWSADDAGNGPNGTVSFTPLRLRKGARRWSVLGLTLDRYRASLNLLEFGT